MSLTNETNDQSRGNKLNLFGTNAVAGITTATSAATNNNNSLIPHQSSDDSSRDMIERQQYLDNFYKTYLKNDLDAASNSRIKKRITNVLIMIACPLVLLYFMLTSIMVPNSFKLFATIMVTGHLLLVGSFIMPAQYI